MIVGLGVEELGMLDALELTLAETDGDTDEVLTELELILEFSYVLVLSEGFDLVIWRNIPRITRAISAMVVNRA